MKVSGVLCAEGDAHANSCCFSRFYYVCDVFIKWCEALFSFVVCLDFCLYEKKAKSTFQPESGILRSRMWVQIFLIMSLENGFVASQSKFMEGFEKDSDEFRPRNNWFHSGSSQKCDVWTRKVDILGNIFMIFWCFCYFVRWLILVDFMFQSIVLIRCDSSFIHVHS